MAQLCYYLRLSLLMNKLVVFLLAILICLPAMLPLLRPQFFHTHDWTHVARLAEMDQAIKDGHFPVRWSKNLGYGYGLPQFSFYAPLAYYLAELFHLIGFSMIGSIKLLIYFNFLVSFVAMYYLGEKLFNRFVGLVSGTAFIYIPYRAVDLYVRGALAELTAITFLALTLMLAVTWFKKPSWRLTALAAAALAGIFLSHNLTGMISLPFVMLTLLMLCLIKQPRKKLFWLQAGSIMVLGLGLAAFYLLPMYLEKQYTMADTLTGGFSDFHHHFLYIRQFFISEWGYGGSIFGVEDDMSFNIGGLQVVLGLVSLAMLFVWRRQLSRLQKGFLGLSWGCVILAMLLATFKTQVIWEAISVMKYIQFPWRYLTVIITYISILAGASVYWLKDKPVIFQGGATATVCLGLMLFNYQFFKPNAYLDNNESLYYTDPSRIAQEMSGVIPDFISRFEADKPPAPPASRFELADPEAGLITISDDRTHRFSLTAQVEKPTLLLIHILNFPGWEIRGNGKLTKINFLPDWPEMTIPLSPQTGAMIIEGYFADTRIRQAANGITVLALGVFIYLAAADPPRNKNKKAKDE